MRVDTLFDCSIMEVIELMESIYNVDLSVYSETFLEKSIINRCMVTQNLKVSEYIIYLDKTPLEAMALKKSVNITYTDFFRDSLAFEIFEQRIIPNLIFEKKLSSEIRIWSAGCSTGQEAYSIAMAMESYISLNAKNIRYRIIATDISEEELEVAKLGIYSEQNFHNIKLKQLNEFFDRKGNIFEISSKIKDKISFSKYNLLDKKTISPKESIFGEFDVIFCKNVLIYYNSEYQQLLLRKLIHSLSDKGYLILGESERHLLVSNSDLQDVVMTSMFFKKNRGEYL